MANDVRSWGVTFPGVNLSAIIIPSGGVSRTKPAGPAGRKRVPNH